LHVPLRFSVELVQAFTGAETILVPIEDLRITATALDIHAAHRISRRLSATRTTMLLVMMMAVDHMRTASEAHHEVEQRRE